MKRLLPILLVLMVLIALLASCGPEDVPTTTFEEPVTQEPETTTKQTYTTTKAKLGMGIDTVDEGWSFWGDF